MAREWIWSGEVTRPHEREEKRTAEIERREQVMAERRERR